MDPLWPNVPSKARPHGAGSGSKASSKGTGFGDEKGREKGRGKDKGEGTGFGGKNSKGKGQGTTTTWQQDKRNWQQGQTTGKGGFARRSWATFGGKKGGKGNYRIYCGTCQTGYVYDNRKKTSILFMRRDLSRMRRVH